ncbi:MAG: hypothetical protein LUQ50_03885 [Methanospirillum sp.]|uniref:hypothetical protein n=1 Tax=Methanospirillum sp. TaxID=45200 RepID=UPI0023722D41|nr:hypothetical protein [Methanospirillum sp.]MDD1728195.1 hypothetical protein [Methanospirillum sp.]
MTLVSPKDQVFPLLCPERECDWVDGWEYDMIHSKSGYAEPGCIFRSRLPYEGECVWIMTDYVPDQYIKIIKICPGLFLLEWSFNLKEHSVREDDVETSRTDLTMMYTMTGLSSEGNEFVATAIDQTVPPMMDWLEKSLNHYLITKHKLSASR